MIIYLFDQRDLDRCGADITLLKSTHTLRDFFTVDDKSRNEVVHRVLELDCKTIVVPDDRYRCTPAMVTIVEVLTLLGYQVQRIGEYLLAHTNRAPAASPIAPPARQGTARGTGTTYREPGHFTHTG